MPTGRRTAYAVGTVSCAVGGVVLVVLTLVLALTGPTTPKLTPVTDPGAIGLGTPHLFGGQVVVYGVAERPSRRPAELGCELFDRSGGRQSQAKLSELTVLDGEPARVDGIVVLPLFTVDGYGPGWYVSCSRADDAVPLAVSEPSTFGTRTGLVVAFLASGSVLLLAMSAAGLLLLHRRRQPRT